MNKITPIKYSELELKCGDPGSTDGMVKTCFPFTLYLNGDKSLPCNNFYGSKRIADAVIDAYDEILDIYGIEFIRENGLDEYGGCFNHRASRGSERLSVHSWGMAIDIIPSKGKYGSPCLIPYHYIQAFKDRGFIWGGDWETPDGMHMSAVIE